MTIERSGCSYSTQDWQRQQVTFFDNFDVFGFSVYRMYVFLKENDIANDDAMKILHQVPFSHP